MLKSTLVPLSLKEPEEKLEDMAGFISHFGTETVYLLHLFSGSEKERARRDSALKDRAAMFRDRGMSTETEIRTGNGYLQIITTRFPAAAPGRNRAWCARGFRRWCRSPVRRYCCCRRCFRPRRIHRSRRCGQIAAATAWLSCRMV